MVPASHQRSGAPYTNRGHGHRVTELARIAEQIPAGAASSRSQGARDACGPGRPPRFDWGSVDSAKTWLPVVRDIVPVDVPFAPLAAARVAHPRPSPLAVATNSPLAPATGRLPLAIYAYCLPPTACSRRVRQSEAAPVVSRLRVAVRGVPSRSARRRIRRTRSRHSVTSRRAPSHAPR